MNRLENLPNELILEIISNCSIEDYVNISKSNKKIAKLCKYDKVWLEKRILIPGFPNCLNYDKVLIYNQIVDVKFHWPNFPKHVSKCRINIEYIEYERIADGPIEYIIKNNYYHLFELCIVNNIIDIDCLLPFYAKYWNLITMRGFRRGIFNIINKYKPAYFHILRQDNHHINNTQVFSFVKHHRHYIGSIKEAYF